MIKNQTQTSEAEEAAMNTDLLLTGEQEHQSDGGSADCRVRADGQLANGLVEQQQERVVCQPGGEIAAHGEKK